jgi:hypothetical protein
MSDGLTFLVEKINRHCLRCSGTHTPEIERRVENFLQSVASIFEAWVNRRKSEQPGVHTVAM